VGSSDGLAEQFEDNRTRLRALAYRMLGSLSEADDAVQEAWLRLSRAGVSAGPAEKRLYVPTQQARLAPSPRPPLPTTHRSGSLSGPVP
jgi:Sigma-70 region 2